MPASLNRNAIRPARGTKAALLANTSELHAWEIVFATDENELYVWTGYELRPVGQVQGSLERKADLDPNTGKLLGEQLPPIALGDLSNVGTSNVVNGSVLVYRDTDGGFVADHLDTLLTITDGGNC